MRLEIFVDNNHPQLNDNVRYIHLTHLQTIDNATCAEIELNDCLDFALERDKFLEVVVSKLRYGGKLNIEGVDLIEAVYNTSAGELNIPQLQELIYKGKMSADSLEDTITKLQKLGLTIEHETVNNNKYFITAIRKLPSEST